ncbi:right-handed parallel beta-helix repeat-containing protein [Streptomyces sp. NPDC126499]|uniref:right-handed parallel beta-helix repeat-containing protein n=1 Tax=Streptomyces sp. NPDC126499 TaxID=3155314 RepID=UPI0033169E0A
MVARYLVAPHGGRRAHPDIASALAAAARRGRAALIEIAPGRYEEHLTVRGEVQLVAAGGAGTVEVVQPRGGVLDAGGAVRVHGLVLAGRDADVVRCHAGTLTLEHTEVRAPGGVAVHAMPGTTVTLRDGVFRHGRVLLAGAGGLVERCRFGDAADNALAAIEGAHVTVLGSRFENSRIHGIRVSGARAHVTGCVLTGTGRAALMADAQAELTVADCVIDAAHGEGIAYIEQSGGSVDRTRVTGCEHGIAVVSGSDPVVRGCAFLDCRDTGINVGAGGRGRFEDCEVVGAGNVAVFVFGGGAPEVHGCRITRGNVGIAVSGARGRFAGIRVADLTSVALRAYDGGKAVFEDVRVERCPTHLETRGDGGTTADVQGALFRDFSLSAVEALGQSRVTLRQVTAERGTVGFGSCEESQLFVYDCEVKAAGTSGALAMGKGRLVARNLTVTGSEALGLLAQDSARLDVADSEFVDCATAGAGFLGTAAGRFADCAVTGTRGVAVVGNGLVDVVNLRTSLRVIERPAEPERPPTVVHQYHGPVIHGPVSQAQFAWGNENVTQNQRTHTPAQTETSTQAETSTSEDGNPA